MISKPRIDAIREKDDWYNHDEPLFSAWRVSWDEPAGCGHEQCGYEWVDEQFATWPAALEFASQLIRKNQ